MTQWEVFLVIIAVVGFLITILTPLLKLNTSITQLTCAVSVLQKNIEVLITKNDESHTKLWEHNSKQDSRLADHETRIKIIENAEKGA